MSSQNEQQTILVEKHYIPVGIYNQIYGNQRPYPSLSSNSFINTSTTNNIPAMNLFSTSQQRPGNQDGNAATIRTTRRTTLNHTNNLNNPVFNSATNHPTQQNNNNIDEHDPPQNGRNADTIRAARTGIRIETIDGRSDDSEANLFNTLFTALINPSRLNGANSYQDRPTGLTANQIEDNSTIISYYTENTTNNQPSSSICSVCTLEYETGQQVRSLDACDHAFHTGCIDRWLADHNTCPLCRSQVMPSTNTNTNTNINSSSQPLNSSSWIRTTTRVDLNGLD
jgi:hypothetical protein